MDKIPGSILVVDDNQDILLAARLLLRQYVAVVHTEGDPEKVLSILKNESYDVILLDMNFTKDATSGQEGFHWLNRILEIDPESVVILITAYGDVEMAVRAIKEGATDFVLKPWQNEKLVATISAALNLRQSRKEVDNLRSRQKQLSADLDRQFHDLIGDSSGMMEVFSTIQKVAETEANILILGENGTGKELVARALHRQSQRANDVFISVDMGALSETLFESELFGHVKGAFTDAREGRAGRIEVASGGTLFLDEIGNLSTALQAKLLTVLESRQVTRLGSNVAKRVEVRLIASTNSSIYDKVAKNEFRQDLIYRINTVEINMPPLREREGDIALLTDHFVDIYSKKYQKDIKRVHPAALKKLEEYHWPGNVRELQHAVERAVIMADTHVLQASDFFLSAPETEKDALTLDDYNLGSVEKAVIRKAIRKHDGNMTRVARELGLTRTSLYRRLEKYGL